MTAILPESIFNTTKTDYEKPSLFLGQTPGLFDTIHKNYPKIWSLYKGMKSLDWDENEFNYAACASDFVTAPKGKVDKMIKSLAWQWEADSVASRAIGPIISFFDPCPELWAAWQRVSDSECLTGDHEVLTPKGWKRIDGITVEDKVAQWDYNTRAITFVEPTRVIVKEHKGEMYVFKDGNKNVSQVTTPNHRMPIIYPYWQAENPPLFKEAKDVTYHGGNALPTAGSILAGGRRMSVQERLYVAVQADGSLCGERYTGERTGKLHYRFSFSKKRKIERLLMLCTAVNWDVTELNITTREEGYRTFIVHVPVEEFNWKAKTFDWFDLDEISYEWAQDFIDEIKYWDGNVTKNNRTRYITSNRECADKVSTIAHLIGMRGHITTLPERIGVLMPSGGLSNTKEVYQVYIAPRPCVVGNVINKTVIDYEGMVYCLEVPTTYFMVRHNGAITVTGNCTHAATYSEIVRMSFPNGNEVLQEILGITEAMQRLGAVAREMAWVRERGLKYQLGLVENNQETYNAVFMFVFLLFVLERVQFMASFAVTFALGQEDLFTQVAKGVQKIATDEYEIHVELDREVLAHELTTDRGKEAYKQLKPRMEEILNEVIASELEWTEFLFSDGQSLDYLTHAQLVQWVYFSATNVAVPLGLEMDTPVVEANPLHYMKTWLNISDFQASPQSEANGQYKVNLLQRDDDGMEFDVDF